MEARRYAAPMASRAKQAARTLSANGVSIDRSILVEGDLEWLADVERLVLWNVRVPPGFLGRLDRLWWVGWGGGSKGQGIEQLQDCKRLRYLSLSWIRGVHDLSFLTEIRTLEMLTLSCLATLEGLPSLGNLTSLRRIEIAQMKRLASIGPAIEAPNLEELLLIKLVKVTAEDVKTIQLHPSLRSFDWLAEDVPDKSWVPVRHAISLPRTRIVRPEDWFSL